MKTINISSCSGVNKNVCKSGAQQGHHVCRTGIFSPLVTVCIINITWRGKFTPPSHLLLSKQKNDWANKCTAIRQAGGGDLLFPSIRLVSCCLRPNSPVESNHPENRICRRTPEVANSRARGKADSRKEKRNSPLSDRSESDWHHLIDLWLQHLGLLWDDCTQWLHKSAWHELLCCRMCLTWEILGVG